MPPSDACQKLSLSPLYFKKTLLHKSSERSSLVSGPGLNSSPLEAKNPASHRSATTFHLGGSSGILQDKMGLIIYVSLLLLTPEILSLPKTMPSCPGLTRMLHSTIGLTAGSVDHSLLHP